MDFDNVIDESIKELQQLKIALKGEAVEVSDGWNTEAIHYTALDVYETVEQVVADLSELKKKVLFLHIDMLENRSKTLPK